MARKWWGRLIALGGLAAVLGCKHHPGVPVCTTPLLPDMTLASAPPLPTGGVLPPPATTRAADALASRPPAGPTEPAAILPPKDVAGSIPPEPPPAIKPLLVEAPKPKAGADGFAPGPRVPDPPDEPVIVPTAARRTPSPPTPLRPGEKIGHAPDYRWVVGVADRHTRGNYWTVRFADIGADDRWGGKVRLLDDDRLKDLQNGDVVYVTGDVLAPASAADSAPAYPPYRITSLTVVEKAR